MKIVRTKCVNLVTESQAIRMGRALKSHILIKYNLLYCIRKFRPREVQQSYTDKTWQSWKYNSGILKVSYVYTTTLFDSINYYNTTIKYKHGVAGKK